jgi:hypothetical protein
MQLPMIIFSLFEAVAHFDLYHANSNYLLDLTACEKKNLSLQDQELLGFYSPNGKLEHFFAHH